MAAIIKILQNSEQDATIKVKTDSSGGSATITKEMLCYRPKPHSCEPSTDAKDRFQDFNERSCFSIRAAQWGSRSQDGTGGVIYRSDTHDLEHEITAFCAGDTCQYDFLGQDLPADCEYDNEDMTVEIEGELTMYLRLRKTGFINYAGEYATYGAFEDDTKLGPKN